MAGLFDFFTGGNQPQQQQQQQPQQTSPNPGNVPDNSQVSGDVPANQNTPPADQQQKKEVNSPLAPFEKMWETASNTGDSDESNGQLELKPEEVTAAVAKLNFSDKLSPEVLAAIANGGEEAQKAFASSLNSVAQNVMSQTLLVSKQLADKTIESAIQKQLNKLPELVRQQNVDSAVTESNPIFKHPAVQPIIKAAQQQLTAANPGMSPAEITQKVNAYVLAMSQAINPTPEPQNPFSNESDVDWEKFLTGQ